MSELLDPAACSDAQRREDLARNDAAMGSLHRAFIVQVKEGARIVHEFGAMGPDSITVAEQHVCLAEAGQYVWVVPASRKEEPVPVSVLRNELAQLALRQRITDEDWVTFDAERNVNKGPKLAARNDAHALDLQVQLQGYIGALA